MHPIQTRRLKASNGNHETVYARTGPESVLEPGRRFRRRLDLKVFAAIGSTIYLLGVASVYAALPDLMVYGPNSRPYIDIVNFASGSCEVQEGCAIAGARRLLRFETESRNLGPGDLIFGDPAQNPLFVYDNCHGHYHFGQFTEYRLLTTSGVEVREGKKIGFCLEDTRRWDSSAGSRRYNCSYQGIQRGWADVYTYDVPCQWIDITDLSAGTYILELRVDPHNLIPEANENNNVTQVTVQIPDNCTSRPANDHFAQAQAIPSGPASVTGNNACGTKEAGEQNHAGNPGGHSVWYRWYVPTSKQVIINTEGSSFDTLLGVYQLVGQAIIPIASNDDIIPQVKRTSQVTFAAQGGVQYHIAVDGWGGEFGSFRLNVDAPPNDHFANSIVLPRIERGNTNGYNIAATHEPNEPTHATTFGMHSVWYTWTAPWNGIVYWDTLGSDFDTSLAIYTGNSVNALTHVASDNDTGADGTSIARFLAVSNTTYRVVVDGRGDAAGNIKTKWRYPVGRLKLTRISPTQVQLTLSGENGTYALQSSSDFATWQRIAMIPVTNRTTTYTLTISPGQHFFRARLAE